MNPKRRLGRSGRVIGAVIAGAALLVAIGAAGAAAQEESDYVASTPEGQAAQSTGSSAEITEEIDTQAPYANLAAEVSDVLGSDPGLAAITVKDEVGELVVHARQDWGADVQVALDDIVRIGADQGIAVTFVDVPYGEDEFLAIWEAVQASAAELGYAVTAGNVVGSLVEGELGFAAPGLLENAEEQAILQELAAQHSDGKLIAVFENETPIEATFSDTRTD